MSFVIKEEQNSLWCTDKRNWSGPLQQEKQAEKRDITEDYFCFPNHPLSTNSIDSDSMALCVSPSLQLCPAGPKRNDSSVPPLCIKEQLTGNYSSWYPSLAFNFYQIYQSLERGRCPCRNISELRLKDITLWRTSIYRMSLNTLDVLWILDWCPI